MRSLALWSALLLGLAALSVLPTASASDCTEGDACVGVCVLRSAQCDNDGDSGNNLCAFAVAHACVPYRDCPPGFGCHPYYGVGAEYYCNLDQGTCNFISLS